MIHASYRCHRGHTVTLDFDRESPSDLPCPECQAPARRYMKATGARHVDLVDLRCGACQKMTEDAIRGEEVTCEHCGSTDVTVALSGGANLERSKDECAPGFPRWDNGLGCVVHSERHRLRVARSKGLVPVDDDAHFTSASQQRADLDEEARLIAAANEYEDRVANAPDFARYRKAADQGALSEEDAGFVARCRQEHGRRSSELR